MEYYEKKPSVFVIHLTFLCRLSLKNSSPMASLPLLKCQTSKSRNPNSINLVIIKNYSFTFEYNGRTFEMFTKTKEEAEVWVACLKFLSEYKSKEMETSTSVRSASYFHTLINTNEINQETVSKDLQDANKKSKLKSKSKSKTRAHKFKNLDAKAYTSVINESKFNYAKYKIDPKLILNKDVQTLSQKALTSKGLWNYLKVVKEKTLKSRMLYGFLKKRSKGRVKYFNTRWFFMISSRPLV